MFRSTLFSPLHSEQKLSFSQQRLHSISLKGTYLPESLSKSLIQLTDKDGDSLALYETDYKKLNAYLKEQKLSIDNLSKLQLLDVIEKSKVRVIKYISPKNLYKYELNPNTTDFSSKGDIFSHNVTCKKEKEHQNCVVMFDDEYGNPHIYVYPKVRSIPGNIQQAVFNTAEDKSASNVGVVGVSHSSFSQGKRVKFAGSFVHHAKDGWRIENYSGHFCTDARNMALFLENLEKKGFNLNKLTVKLWNNSKQRSSVEEENVMYYENAAHFLQRMKKSKIEINANLNGLSVSDERMADSAFGKGYLYRKNS